MTFSKTVADAAISQPTDSEAIKQMPDLDEIGIYDGWDCNNCCATILEDDGGPLYRCDECAYAFIPDVFDEVCDAQCRWCGTFVRMVAEHGCDYCRAATAYPVQFVRCPECSEKININHWARHWNDEHSNDADF